LKLSLNKNGKSEADKVQDLEKKIRFVETKNKDLSKEIKQLKKLQHDNGNELMELDDPDSYPEKIR
jgi:hypothetical protein